MTTHPHSSAHRARRKRTSQRTIALTVLCAALVLLFDIYNTHAQRQSAQRSTVALAALPAVEVADPDPGRTPYKRDQYQPHGWIDADGDGCNTRREVLIEEAKIKPAISPDGCKLSGGQWGDRFSPNFTTSDEQDVQIDHLVALADADRSGGWRWPAEQKIAFANQLDNPDELNALSSAANNDKSDKGPDEWMPKDKQARCDYIRAYVSIKSRWHLTVSPAQWNAIAKAWPQCTPSPGA